MSVAPDTCPVQGKLRYATRSGAFTAAERMNKRRPSNGIKQAPCEVYRCPHCHAFHIGHRDLVKSKRRKT